MGTVKYKFLFEERWQEVEGSSDQLLVEMTIAKEIRTPHACLEGGCGSCKCKLLEGKVDLGPNDILTEKDVKEGFILACQSRPLTPTITVNFDFE